jgi:hypothetical protein
MTAAAQGITVSPKQLKQLLVACIRAKEPVLIKGSPGIGKTDIGAEAAAEADIKPENFIVSHPIVEDPTDSKGLPWKAAENNHAEFLPYGDLMRLIHATEPTVNFIDDFGQASEAVQKSKMQQVLARQIGSHKISPHVVFIAATNRRGDRAGVSGILEPVKSRFTIVELKPTLEDYIEWGVANHVPASVLGFLKNRPELLCKFEPTADITNGPNPRNWTALGRLQMMLQNADSNLRMAAFAGRIGDADAASYAGFLEMLEKAPDPDAILADPKNAPLPSVEDPGIAYAVALAVAYRADVKNFGAIVTYAKRMFEGELAEFSAVLLRDSQRTIGEEKIVSLPAFVKLAKEPMAAALFASVR